MSRRAALPGLLLALVACASLPGSGDWPAGEPRVEARPSADLPAPPALRARDGELRAVPLTWKPVLGGGAAGYVIERAPAVAAAPAGDGAFERIASVWGRFAVDYVDRDPALRDGTTYRYRLRTVGADGAVGLPVSPVAEGTTARLPAPPRGVEAYSHLPRKVALQWRASPDPHVVGYVVQRSPAADGPFLSVARLEGRFETTWVDEGLGDLRVFYYRLASVNAAGAQGQPGEPVQAVTKAEPLPPVGLRVAERRLGANRLAWQPNAEEDVAGYRLLRRRAGEQAPRVVVELPPDRTWAEDHAVGAGEDLTYRVVAFDVDGLESEPSDPVSVASEDYRLDANPVAEGIALRWEPRDEEGFAAARVYRLGWLRRRELARVEGRRFVDTDVEPGRTYRYAVVLERADGSQAPPSAVLEATAPLAPPPPEGPPAEEETPPVGAPADDAPEDAARGSDAASGGPLHSGAQPLDSDAPDPR